MVGWMVAVSVEPPSDLRPQVGGKSNPENMLNICAFISLNDVCWQVNRVI